jgi:hypothetical protein
MAEISVAVSFAGEVALQISEVMADADFTHRFWGSDDLAAIRSLIRSHYRGQQNGQCAYCKNPVSLHDAMNCHVEHIAPKSKYPEFIFEPKNLCVICSECNAIKRNQEVLGEEPDTVVNGTRRVRYPRSSNAFLIVHPHFDLWEDHIQVFGKFYVDKTRKGHFTIGACVLNRHLRQFGWEPPLVNDEDMRNAMTIYLNSTDPVAKTSALMRLMRLLNQL